MRDLLHRRRDKRGQTFPFRLANDAQAATKLAEFIGLGAASSYVQSVALSPTAKLLAYGVATDHVTALATSPF